MATVGCIDLPQSVSGADPMHGRAAMHTPLPSWVIRDRAVSLETQPMTAVASKRTSAERQRKRKRPPRRETGRAAGAARALRAAILSAQQLRQPGEVRCHPRRVKACANAIIAVGITATTDTIAINPTPFAYCGRPAPIFLTIDWTSEAASL